MSEHLDLSGLVGGGAGYDFSGRGGIGSATFDGRPVPADAWRDPGGPQTAPDTAAGFLAVARNDVAGPRAAAHGDKHVTFANIAELWAAYDKCRAREREHGAADGQGFHLAETALTVADKMELLKIARSLAGAYNPDDYIDRAGYAACAGEIASAADHPSRHFARQDGGGVDTRHAGRPLGRPVHPQEGCGERS